MAQTPAMLSERQRRFLEASRVGHLATADAKSTPHLIPVCYAEDKGTLYITVDEKPKRQDIPLKRVRNDPGYAAVVRLISLTGPANPASGM